MGKMRKNMIMIYQNLRYFIKSFRTMGKKKIKQFDNARDIVMQFSPKPIGYYNNVPSFRGGSDNESVVDLSIILPIYNVEQYLKECLDSLIQQNTKFSYEIVCIDDGSPDHSIDILEEYRKKYSFIRIIRQENRGLSGARNRGLDEAKGRYITFVDSDDKIASDMVEVMLKEAIQNDYDIVCCGFYTFNQDGNYKQYVGMSESSKDKGAQILRKNQCYLWGKIYKRAFWDNISLPEGYLFEDMIVLHIFPKLLKSYSYIAKPFYGYRMNINGIMATAPKNPKSVDQYWMIEYIEDELERLYLDKDSILYRGLLKELGPYLLNRTVGLPTNIRVALFELASMRVNQWNFNNKSLNISEKRLLKAFKKHNYELWEAVASCWY